MTKVEVTLSEDGLKFTHSKGEWSSTEPIERLPDRIKFYRKLAGKRPQVYRQDYDALRGLEQKIRGVK